MRQLVMTMKHFLAILLVLPLSHFAAAQDEGGEFDFGNDSGFEEPVDNNDAALTGELKSGAGGTEPETRLTDSDPAVNEILLAEPKTADELVRAIDVLSSLDRHDLAKQYLDKLIALQLDKTAMANLHRRVGSGALIRLSRISELNPTAKDFAAATLKAASELREDPKRLTSLVEQTQSADLSGRRRLARELVAAGPAAVAPILKGVAENPNGDAAPYLRTAISVIGQPAVGPLVAFLDSPRESQRNAAARILGFMKSDRAIPFLARGYVSPDSSDDERQAAATAIRKITGQSPSASMLVDYTRDLAMVRYEGRIPTDLDVDGRAETWIWDQDAEQPVRYSFAPVDVAQIEAARHFETLHLAGSISESEQVKRLVTMAGAATIQNGIDLPLNSEDAFWSVVKSASSSELSTAYAEAMSHGNVSGMVGLAQALASSGDTDVLYAEDGQLSPLGKGLIHADSRVRFAAADAVAKLGPTRQFSGNSRLVETLAHFASSKGKRAALVAHPRADLAQSIGGLLNASGFDVEVVSSSKEVLKRAAHNADFEFFLLSDAFDRPVTHQLIQLLRQNPLTAKTPIGILSRPQEQSDAPMIEELHPRVITLPESREPETIARAIRRLAVEASDSVSAERRSEMSYASLSHLAALAKQQKLLGIDLTRYVDEISRAATTHGLADHSIEVLGRVGSPIAQSRLLEIANQHLLPVGQRMKAAEAFSESTERFGIMLTRRQMLTQYDVYNASEALDQPTQELLGTVLDAIENRLTN
ncbi:MAG: HEAT repeat domain-containing protein [Planctomycetales bacterium]|nr:HEAT repeat domain-containing protein [Planctomycetales bacterium]